MKKTLLLSAAATTLCLLGFSHSAIAATDPSADKAKADAVNAAAVSPSDKNAVQPKSAPATTTGKSAHPNTAAAGTSSAASAPAPVAAGDGGAVATPTYQNKETYPHTSSNASSTALIGGGGPQAGGEPIAASASVIQGRVKEWNLSAADLQAEVASGTPIVRTKAMGAGAPAGRTDDEALHTLINNRLLADTDTVRVATKMDVKNGEVTLRGDAGSAELIGRTMAIVLDTNGVTKVTSEMKIDASQPGALRDDASRIPSDKAQLQTDKQGEPPRDNP